MKRLREYPVGWTGVALLVAGAVVPTFLGAAVIGTMMFWALPTAAALGERHVLLQNLVTSGIYFVFAASAGVAWGYVWLLSPPGADEATVRRTILASPRRMAVIHGTVWIGATVLLVALNTGSPWLATTVGVSMLVAATVTTAMSYWMCERALRPAFASLLTDSPPAKAQRPGLRMRAVGAWVVGTGVPILLLMLVAASALVVDYPGDRLAWVVLAFGTCALASGLTVATFTAATTADPIDEVRRGMERIERADYDASVPVFDTSELGLLQAGFNTMAGGLRERERLRDLFGRHVGRDVARLAEQSARADSQHGEMGGENCEVAVLFVDLVDSTRLAARLPPEELVAVLNVFFAIVVEVVEEQHGLINKFEGDAALAIFGAPVPTTDPAGQALAAARKLNDRLKQPGHAITAGIGVSAGMAVAGYVGDPSRYEYTVIGDPVNEAARLTEVAKRSGGVVVSGAALSRAHHSEARRWHIVDSELLRGRDTPTQIAVPTGGDPARRSPTGENPPPT